MSKNLNKASSTYAADVKQAICKLLDYTYQNKWRNVSFDTDEDTPSVSLWTGVRTIKVCGFHCDKVGWIHPQPEEENWSFLECCNRVLYSINQDK